MGYAIDFLILILDYVYTMHNTIGLTLACYHANRVNGVNEHSLHVGHSRVLSKLGCVTQNAECTHLC